MSTVRVEILGSGCQKCRQLEANARSAIATHATNAEVIHITDPVELVRRNALITPALAINGIIVSWGQVMTAQQIEPLLNMNLEMN